MAAERSTAGAQTPVRERRSGQQTTPVNSQAPPFAVRIGPTALTAGGLAGSLSWRVNAERIVLLGWGRAILLQLAHPLVAAGVFDHGTFKATPLTAATRLFHTVHAMLSLTFGTDATKAQALGRIQAIHRRVHGALPQRVGPFPAGTAYSAEDPALVLWVHGTLIESVVLAYDRLVSPLSTAEQDDYCREAAALAVALGAREDEVPRTWTQLRTYVDGVHACGVLRVSPQARELAPAVLAPPGSWAIAPGAWIARTLTLGLLPPSIREEYGLPWTARRQRTFDGLVSALRVTRRVVPDALALWPDARRRRHPSTLALPR